MSAFGWHRIAAWILVGVGFAGGPVCAQTPSAAPSASQSRLPYIGGTRASRLCTVVRDTLAPAVMRLMDSDARIVDALLMQGVHPKVVQDRLGHSSITVTLDTYSHAIPSLGREAGDLFDRAASGD
ncbi:MAG TPA: hypothetical protein VK669_14875 [Candidatus Limnocylindrales bacterium]|nr:hypothetical protein [Candidatus Limnocylindrales bacterium]